MHRCNPCPGGDGGNAAARIDPPRSDGERAGHRACQAGAARSPATHPCESSRESIARARLRDDSGQGARWRPARRGPSHRRHHAPRAGVAVRMVRGPRARGPRTAGGRWTEVPAGGSRRSPPSPPPRTGASPARCPLSCLGRRIGPVPAGDFSPPASWPGASHATHNPAALGGPVERTGDAAPRVILFSTGSGPVRKVKVTSEVERA